MRSETGIKINEMTGRVELELDVGNLRNWRVLEFFFVDVHVHVHVYVYVCCRKKISGDG